jgi:uncharacterized integral membrane protein
MIRWLTLALTGLAAIAAFAFSLLNRSPARLDLGLWNPELPLGVLTLCALLLGAILGGGVLYLGVVVPLRLRLRRAQRESRSEA